MAAEIELLVDFAVMVVIAALVTVLFHRLKQPTIFGYIVAGIIIGPYTLPFSLVKNLDVVRFLAELGVILLLFSLGLQFSLRKLRRVGLVAVLVGSLEMTLMITIGYYVGQAFGWSQIDSVFLGAILAISSTAIVLKVLMNLNAMREVSSQIMFGVLVVQDLAAVIILTILAGVGSQPVVSLVDMGTLVFRIVIFVMVFLALGVAIVPRGINYVAKLRVDEVLLLTVLGLAFGMAFFTFALGFTTAVGAFLVGMVVAEARDVEKIVRLTSPIRDIFAALFFVSIGMLFNFSALQDMILPVIIVTVIAVAGKAISCGFGTLISGFDGETATKVGFGMAPIGEFSFIIAKLGRDLRLTSGFLFPLAIFASVATTVITPYLLKAAPAVNSKLSAAAPKPLRLYASYFTVWMVKLRQGSTGQLADMVNAELRRIFIHVVIVATIVLVSQTALSYLEGLIPGMNLPLIQLQVIVAVVLSFPSLIKIVRSVDRLLNVASVALLKGVLWTDTTMARNLVRTVFALLAVTILTLLFIPMVSLFAFSAAPIVVATVFAVAVIGYLLQGHIKHLNQKLEDALHRILVHPSETQEEKES